MAGRRGNMVAESTAMAYKYKPADCPHADDWSWERSDFGGQKTGDIICSGCGETFAPSEPEYERLIAAYEAKTGNRVRRYR